MASIEPVSVSVAVAVAATVAVADPSSIREPGSGVRNPGSGVRLLQRDQVNPVTVSDSVTVSVSVSVTVSVPAAESEFRRFDAGSNVFLATSEDRSVARGSI